MRYRTQFLHGLSSLSIALSGYSGFPQIQFLHVVTRTLTKHNEVMQRHVTQETEVGFIRLNQNQKY